VACGTFGRRKDITIEKTRGNFIPPIHAERRADKEPGTAEYVPSTLLFSPGAGYRIAAG
jgi:hypothetical protein